MTDRHEPPARDPGNLGFEHEVLDHVSNLVCISVDGRIVYANPAAARALAMDSPSDILEHRFSDFLDGDYGALWDEDPGAFAGETKSTRVRLRPNNGKRPSVDLTVRRLESLGRAAFVIEARDVTEYIRASVATRKREQRLRGILDAVGDGIVACDEKGIVTIFNPAAESMFGRRARDVLGGDIAIVLPDPFARDRYRHLLEVGGEACRGLLERTNEFCGERADKYAFPIEMLLSELIEGRHRLLIAVVRDITERKREEERIRRLAHYDAVTALPNRYLLNERLERALARARRGRSNVALMFLDLDRFKPVNDTLGHEAGDALLKDVAARLSECVRITDTVARLGGDEFVVVLEGLEEEGGAGLVARKILETLHEPFLIGDRTFVIGASMGISLFPADAERADELIARADAAMYRAKAGGRNAFLFARS